MNNQKLSRSDSETVAPFTISRRRFLKILGGGIIVYFAPIFPGEVIDAFAQGARELSTDFNAFLRISEDGRVSCFTGKIEMGQGIATSLAQMLAEELDVSLTSVHMVMGDTDQYPWDAGTNGSMSVKYFGPPLRAAAAEAKAVLIQLAAEHLNVPPDRLETRSGVVADKQEPKKEVSYGTLTKGKRIEKHLDHKPSLNAGANCALSGKLQGRTYTKDYCLSTDDEAGVRSCEHLPHQG